MSNNLNKSIWLIGAGQMAVDYYKVLNDLDVFFKVIGRGNKSAKSFYNKTGVKPILGGLDSFLAGYPEKCSHAIVAVGVERLAETTKQLLKYGIQNILVEKPAGLNKEEIESVAKLTKEENANVFVAYNRRFYSSVIKAKEIIEVDGGVTSFNFEFTEWAHTIEPLKKALGVKENWFLANSTHVVDLAFHLGGQPKEISSFVSGGLDWHPSASIFSGAGISESGALFSYQANWESAGRWSVEMLTKEHRLFLIPLEKLQIQKRGSIEVKKVCNINYTLDEMYKPGLFKQINAFLMDNIIQLFPLNEQMVQSSNYNKMLCLNKVKY
jgi:predicted dehydrogenase